MATPSQALHDAGTATGGSSWSRCDPWEDTLGALASALGAGGRPPALGWRADRRRMEVSADGHVIESGWTFDVPANEARFEQASAPPEGALIHVECRTAIECRDG